MVPYLNAIVTLLNANFLLAILKNFVKWILDTLVLCTIDLRYEIDRKGRKNKNYLLNVDLIRRQKFTNAVVKSIEKMILLLVLKSLNSLV